MSLLREEGQLQIAPVVEEMGQISVEDVVSNNKKDAKMAKTLQRERKLRISAEAEVEKLKKELCAARAELIQLRGPKTDEERRQAKREKSSLPTLPAEEKVETKISKARSLNPFNAISLTLALSTELAGRHPCVSAS